MADTEKIIRKKYDVPIWHKSNLTIDALMQNNPQQAFIAIPQGAGLNFRREQGSAVRKPHAPANLLQKRRRHLPAHRYLIFLGDMMPRMHKPVCPLAVICQQKRPFGKIIKSANGIDTCFSSFLRQERKNRGTALRIVQGTDNLHGLVQQIIQKGLFPLQTAPVNTNPILGLNLTGRIPFFLIINGNMTGKNKFIGFAPGTETSRGNGLVESLRHSGGRFFFRDVRSDAMNAPGMGRSFLGMHGNSLDVLRERMEIKGVQVKTDTKVYIITIMGIMGIPGETTSRKDITACPYLAISTRFMSNASQDKKDDVCFLQRRESEELGRKDKKQNVTGKAPPLLAVPCSGSGHNCRALCRKIPWALIRKKESCRSITP